MQGHSRQFGLPTGSVFTKLLTQNPTAPNSNNDIFQLDMDEAGNEQGMAQFGNGQPIATDGYNAEQKDRESACFSTSHTPTDGEGAQNSSAVGDIEIIGEDVAEIVKTTLGQDNDEQALLSVSELVPEPADDKLSVEKFQAEDNGKISTLLQQDDAATTAEQINSHSDDPESVHKLGDIAACYRPELAMSSHSPAAQNDYLTEEVMSEGNEELQVVGMLVGADLPVIDLSNQMCM
jgi:hypothetical protein